MTDYLHGVEVVEAESGARVVAPSGATFIGIVGTSETGPTGGPRTTLGQRAADELWGSSGTIPEAIAAVHSQGRAPAIACVNAFDPETHVTDVTDEAGTWAAVDEAVQLEHKRISAVSVKDSSGAAFADTNYSVDAEAGTLTLLTAGSSEATKTFKVTYSYADSSTVAAADVAAAAPKLCEAAEASGRTPDVLIAPGWTEKVGRDGSDVIDSAAVTTALAAVADSCRAVVVADAPGTTRADALAYRAVLGSRRVYVVDPKVKVLSGDGTAERAASGYVAGLIARIDADVGWWASPSNRELRGIAGTSRFVSFGLGDADSEANVLNASQVATIIRATGWRLWGNRTCSADPKWQFLSVVRTADRINEAILRTHLWAVDRNISRTYVSDVVEGVNNYLRSLVADGAILGGRCWADPDLNPTAQVQGGRLYLDFDFTPAAPAERITFRSRLVDDYAETIF